MPKTLPVPLAGKSAGATVPEAIGELWTARQRQGHSLHEISYRACFKPQLPEYFIARHSREGDTVLDPFMGRGTTPLQACLMKRVGIGSDINPLSAMLLRPRLQPPHLTALRRRIEAIPMTAKVPATDRELLVFFHPKTLRVLVSCKRWFAEREANGEFDAVDDWLRMVCINRLTGHSPGFLSVKTMPPNQCVSIASQRAINHKHNRSPGKKDFAAIILKKSRNLLRSGRPPIHYASHASAECSAASELAWLADNSVDLLVTSPPFMDIVDYHQDNWMRCWFADIAARNTPVDRHRNIASWRAFVRHCFTEFARVVKPGGHIAFEVGEVRKGTILLEREVLNAVAGLPFSVEQLFINQQRFTKTSNCWGVENNKSGTLSNRVLLLKRSA